MIVVDTSAWIEWMMGSPLGLQLAAHFPAPSASLVPTMVLLELAKWAVRQGGVPRLNIVRIYTARCHIQVLDGRIAKRAALMHRRLKLATADAAIYATARTFRVPLLTCDAHFAHLPSVIYFPKH